MAPTQNVKVKRRTKYDFEEWLRILVGPDEKEYVLHRDLVCKTSDFFRAAVERDWEEARAQGIRLLEVEPRIFTIYTGWLYTGIVDPTSPKILSSDGTKADTKAPQGFKCHALECIYAYALGEMVQDADFRNAIIDKLLKASYAQQKFPGLDNVLKAWDTASHDSKLIRLLVDFWAADSNPADVKNKVDSLPKEFLAKLAVVCVEERMLSLEERRPQNRTKCFYHDHKTEADKCK